MAYRSNVRFAALAFAVTLAACGEEQAQTSPESSSESSATASAPALRLYVIDCGSMQADPARFRLQRSEIMTDVLGTPCFFITHPRGTLVWDVGSVPDSDWTPTGGPVAHHLVLPDKTERNLTLTKPLLPQLAELGFQPAGITFIALSHYHWDHVANANAFAGATWLVRKVERDLMFTDMPPVTVPAWYARLKDAKTVIIEGDADHDVFGDGSVIIKSAPGHTPGHQMLYLKLPQTGPVVLSGDLYHFREARALKRVPTFDYDQKQTPISREKAEAFLASSGAQLWIQHDSSQIGALKHAPEYYD
jgi:N-acyl homoserine lactone hydrolase